MATAQEAKRDFHGDAAALIRGANAASLATVSGEQPFAAWVTVAWREDLSPVLLLSTLSTHTRQLLVNPACALLVVGQAADENPQTAPRVTISGRAAKSVEAADRECFLGAHPYAAMYADFTDFSFWRIELGAAHYVGGFAAAARLDVAQLKVAGAL